MWVGPLRTFRFWRSCLLKIQPAGESLSFTNRSVHTVLKSCWAAECSDWFHSFIYSAVMECNKYCTFVGNHTLLYKGVNGTEETTGCWDHQKCQIWKEADQTKPKHLNINILKCYFLMHLHVRFASNRSNYATQPEHVSFHFVISLLDIKRYIKS